MKCISYGYVVLFTIGLIIIGQLIGMFAGQTFTAMFVGAGSLGLLIWFVVSLFASCCTPVVGWFDKPRCPI